MRRFFACRSAGGNSLGSLPITSASRIWSSSGTISTMGRTRESRSRRIPRARITDTRREIVALGEPISEDRRGCTFRRMRLFLISFAERLPRDCGCSLAVVRIKVSRVRLLRLASLSSIWAWESVAYGLHPGRRNTTIGTFSCRGVKVHTVPHAQPTIQAQELTWFARPSARCPVVPIRSPDPAYVRPFNHLPSCGFYFLSLPRTTQRYLQQTSRPGIDRIFPLAASRHGSSSDRQLTCLNPPAPARNISSCSL